MRRLLLFSLLFSTPALAASMAGVTMSDSTSISGAPLVLNGLGLREKYFIDVYVAGLYLPAATTDAEVAMDPAKPKLLEFEFLLDISAEQLGDSMREWLDADPEAAKHTDTIIGWMPDVKKGDRMVMRYEPGVGTSIAVKGVDKGTIPGTAVMTALFDIYLGDKPPTEALKKGLLGL